MKKLFLFIALLFLVGVLPAQNTRHWHRPDTRIPYRMVNGKIIIDAEVNGQIRSFVFDTGASRTVITDTFSQELGLDSIRRSKTSDSGGQERSLAIVQLDTLKVGDWIIPRNKSIVINGDNPIFRCYRIEGIIGSDILHKAAVRIQPRDSVLILTENAETLWNLNRDDAVKIKLFGTRPFLKLHFSREIQKASHWALLDTGAPGYSCRQSGHFPHLEEQRVLDTLMKGIGRASYGLFGEEPEAEKWRGIVSKMHIGQATLEQVPAGSSQSSTSLIGTFILNYGDLTIDYRKKRLYYEPFAEDMRLEPSFSPISPMFLGDRMVVGVVWDDHLKTLIQSGDRIVSVNGRPADEYDRCNIMTEGFDMKEGLYMTVESHTGDMIEVTLAEKKEE